MRNATTKVFSNPETYFTHDDTFLLLLYNIVTTGGPSRMTWLFLWKSGQMYAGQTSEHSAYDSSRLYYGYCGSNRWGIFTHWIELVVDRMDLRRNLCTLNAMHKTPPNVNPVWYACISIHEKLQLSTRRMRAQKVREINRFLSFFITAASQSTEQIPRAILTHISQGIV